MRLRRLGTAARRDPLLTAGLLAAYGGFAATFRGPRDRFWQRMTTTGLSLGSLALITEPGVRGTRIRGRDVVGGLAAAAALYGVFQAGDRLARRVMPNGGGDIEAIYGLRRLRPRAELALRLGTIVGPAEELFWRGFVDRRLGRALGPWRGAAAGAAAYAGAHLVTGNPTLVGAAGVAGAFWAALDAAGAPMGALVVSHIAWDVWTFLVAPTSPVREPGAGQPRQRG